MIYLKTIFTCPNEVKYLKLNLKESFNYIDKFIICEFNRTHIGSEKELIFEQYLQEFTQEEQKKIIYIGADISHLAIYEPDNNEIIHNNERLMRGYFVKQLDLNGNDVVFSVDADEIIFGQYYEKVLKKIGFFTKAILLPLHQFFYRINYLWDNNTFIAPTVSKVSYYKNVYPAQWRYDGKLFSEKAGCHFSWCLTIDEMIAKLGMYSHHKDYRHLAKKEVLEDAVKNKTYPFDRKVDFHIKVIDFYRDKEFFPVSIYTMLDEFKYLISE